MAQAQAENKDLRRQMEGRGVTMPQGTFGGYFCPYIFPVVHHLFCFYMCPLTVLLNLGGRGIHPLGQARCVLGRGAAGRVGGARGGLGQAEPGRTAPERVIEGQIQ